MNRETEEINVTFRSLRVLEEIEKNPKISQRELANRLGVALGFINALVKTLVRKGLIKIRGENNRTLTYHLTHAGVLEKSKLAVKWTLNTIDFYRQARQHIRKELHNLAVQGIKSVALYGVGELTEISAIVAPEVGLRIVGIIDDQGSERQVLGLPNVRLEDFDELRPDAVILCIRLTDEQSRTLSEHLEAETVMFRLI